MTSTPQRSARERAAEAERAAVAAAERARILVHQVADLQARLHCRAAEQPITEHAAEPPNTVSTLP